MLRLQECIDLCGLNPDQARALSERATLPEVAAAQAQCPRQGRARAGHKSDGRHATTAKEPVDDETVECELLDKVHAARDFGELKRVLDRYCAFTTHLHHH